ncbi:Uncharacterized protein BP5553_03196 [Venustampulla echinocandica]|uniref:Altered inheritance of mitochondria protein 41 n=1 Tax=Venustampulla echinocandica TaxID=2656787 RepID=A0A370TTJ5_9HELO|nr:Uncharacterized protein BP5553_03196 [Venustampulla echinocandica]RDL38856.1 Uncharacterized protein BP5553_03196 [Venustampulla echinocandica]
MQQKDTNRLAVLRSILSQTLNASKTSSPICTDMQMLALLRKTTNASKTAREDFKKAGREDLVEKEESQIRIMEEYVGTVEVIGEEDVRNAVRSVVEGLKKEGEAKKVGMGEVLKKVLDKDLLGEKNVEKSELVRIVKDILAKP